MDHAQWGCEGPVLCNTADTLPKLPSRVDSHALSTCECVISSNQEALMVSMVGVNLNE
jgi:hypothetical protein